MDVVRQASRGINTNTNMPNDYNIKRLIVKNKLFFVIIVFLQLTPVLHYLDTLQYALKVRKYKKSGDRQNAKRYHLMMLKEDQDVALLRVFECFLESAPQQILHLSLILKHRDNKINFELIHQIGSIISSLVSMGWAMASYHRSIRLAQSNKYNISFIGTIFQFLWHFFITVARILSLSVIASIWPLYTIIFCLIHWIIMTICILVESQGILEFCRTYNRPTHVQPSVKEYIYSVFFASVIGIIHIFIYLNTVSGKTTWKHLCFYFLCFMEDVISNLLRHIFSVRDDQYFNIFSICIISYFLGIAAMFLYFSIFHPTRRQNPRQNPQEILNMTTQVQTTIQEI